MRDNWLHRFVSDLQVVIGAVPYANRAELKHLFSEFADAIPSPPSRVERCIVGAILTKAVRRLHLVTMHDDSWQPMVDHELDTPLGIQFKGLACACLDAKPQGRCDPRLHHFYAALEQHYAVPGLEGASIARELGVSPLHLNRLLRQRTGAGFRTHLRETRIRRAARLLRTTSDSVKSIAISCGYRSPSEFVRHFRATLGHTPTAYRQTRESTPTLPYSTSTRTQQMLYSVNRLG
jgi:AraC-like DNA-binding protein